MRRRLAASLFATLLAATLPAAAETLALEQGSDLVGSVRTVRANYEDTLTDIARRTGLGYEDMVRANPGMDPWLPGQDAEVVLPTRYVLPAGARQGLVVNIAEFRLYYFTRIDDYPMMTAVAKEPRFRTLVRAIETDNARLRTRLAAARRSGGRS